MTFIAFVAFVAMILTPAQSITGVSQGISLCITKVIPALFPFFVCTKLLMGTGVPEMMGKVTGRPFEVVFGVNRNCSFAFITGLLCGYPLGAKVVADMYKEGLCTKGEAQRMLSFCNNSGPLFIMGTVGTGILFSYRAGLVLYITHILSAVVVGIIVRLIIPVKRSICPVTMRTYTPSSTLHTALWDSTKSMATVCANILFFSVIITAIKPVIAIIAPAHQGLLQGVVEITTGISSLNITSLPVISFLLAWSGVSVIMQTDSIIAPLGLSTTLFALTKLIQGITAGMITYLVMPLASIPTPDTFSYIPTILVGSALVTLCAIGADKIKKSL